MKNSFLKLSLLPFLLFTIISSCKKEDEKVLLPLLTRHIELTYNSSLDDSKSSFATLNEDKDPFVFNWADAKNESAIIHLAYSTVFGDAALTSPENSTTQQYEGPNGVDNWASKTEAVFDSNLSDVQFSSLTREQVEAGVPDSGFGLNNAATILVQPGKIIRFIQKDSKGNLIYKGYIKIETVDNMNNPSVVNMDVKYVSKVK